MLESYFPQMGQNFTKFQTCVAALENEIIFNSTKLKISSFFEQNSFFCWELCDSSTLFTMNRQRHVR